jgi:hypothetical protein
LRPLEPLSQAPQSRYPPAADPGPMNPEDNRRLSVYPHVEVERAANVCPFGLARDAGDQGRHGRIICAGSGSEPARQPRGRGRSFDSGHGNGPPTHPRKGPPANMAQSCRDATRPRRRGGNGPSFEILACASVLSLDPASQVLPLLRSDVDEAPPRRLPPRLTTGCHQHVTSDALLPLDAATSCANPR